MSQTTVSPRKTNSHTEIGVRHGYTAADCSTLGSVLDNFGEYFPITLEKSKAFDKVWHQTRLAKRPSKSSPPLI